jgi:raffinose/stachyose/melibiose transport system permease protein
VLFVEIVEALVFMNILLITIPPLIVYLFFNRQIVAGMTAGAVKG